MNKSTMYVFVVIVSCFAMMAMTIQVGKTEGGKGVPLIQSTIALK